MIHSKGMKEFKTILTNANGTIKTNIFAKEKGYAENMLMIITIANDIINKERKRSTTIHNNNNMQITTNNSSSV